MKMAFSWGFLPTLPIFCTVFHKELSRTLVQVKLPIQMKLKTQTNRYSYPETRNVDPHCTNICAKEDAGSLTKHWQIHSLIKWTVNYWVSNIFIASSLRDAKDKPESFRILQWISTSLAQRSNHAPYKIECWIRLSTFSLIASINVGLVFQNLQMWSSI